MSNSYGTPWTVACQASLSIGFHRQEYWNGLPFLSPGDLPNPGTGPMSPALARDFFTTEPPGKSWIPCGPSLMSFIPPRGSLVSFFMDQWGDGYKGKKDELHREADKCLLEEHWKCDSLEMCPRLVTLSPHLQEWKKYNQPGFED